MDTLGEQVANLMKENQRLKLASVTSEDTSSWQTELTDWTDVLQLFTHYTPCASPRRDPARLLLTLKFKHCVHGTPLPSLTEICGDVCQITTHCVLYGTKMYHTVLLHRNMRHYCPLRLWVDQFTKQQLIVNIIKTSILTEICKTSKNMATTLSVVVERLQNICGSSWSQTDTPLNDHYMKSVNIGVRARGLGEGAEPPW